MKKEGIKGYSNVTINNSQQAILNFVLEMVERGKIKPYNQTNGGKNSFGSLCNFGTFFKLTPKKKEIVGKALKGEGEGLYFNRNNYLYCLRNYKHFKLPRSAWDHLYDGIKINWKDIRIHYQYSRNMYKIYKLEESILKNGLKRDKPLLLRFYEKPEYTPSPHIDLVGGNHRLQAIRNLVRRKKLRRDTPIPCIVFKRR
jgi:hypothetical protein